MQRVIGVAMMLAGLAGLLLGLAVDQDDRRPAEAPAAAGVPLSSAATAAVAPAQPIPKPESVPATALAIDSAVDVTVFQPRPGAKGATPTLVRISPPLLTVPEGGGPAAFDLTLSEPLDRPAVLVFATLDGTAKGGEDFDVQRGTVMFQPGSTEARLEMDLIDNRVTEGERQFQIMLSADPNVLILTSRRLLVTIEDDD
jgi:hypothetical protein